MAPETKKPDAKKTDSKKSDPKKVEAPKSVKGEEKPVKAKKTPVAEVIEIERGLKLEPHQVLLRTLITEKNVGRSERLNEYAFEVHPQAEKIDVRSAIEELFKVRVTKVRTQNRQGKARRYKNRIGMTNGWKKALVTLHPDDKINFI